MENPDIKVVATFVSKAKIWPRLSRRFRRRLRGRYYLLLPPGLGVLLSRETFSAVNIRAGEGYTINVRVDLN